MIKRIQKVKPKPDKIQEARQWAKEIIDFNSKEYPEIIFEVYWEKFGDAQAIHFYSQYESVTEMEKINDQPYTPEFLAIYNKGVDLFVEGRNEVTIIQSF